MNNKKGFTLIELLAVIVILAIIALIAVPIVLNMISHARRSAARSAALGYVDAIEYNNGFANAEMEGYTLITGTKNVSEINVKMKGKKPDSGSVTITNDGKVESATLCINGYNVKYTGKDAKVEGKCSSNDNSNNNQQTQVVYYTFGSEKKSEPDESWHNYVKEIQVPLTKETDEYEFVIQSDDVTMHSKDYGITFTSLTDCQSAVTQYGYDANSCVLLVAAGSTYMGTLSGEVCINSSLGRECFSNNYDEASEKIKEYFGFNENTWTKINENKWVNSDETLSCYFESRITECSTSSFYVNASDDELNKYTGIKYPSDYFWCFTSKTAVGCNP